MICPFSIQERALRIFFSPDPDFPDDMEAFRDFLKIRSAVVGGHAMESAAALC